MPAPSTALAQIATDPTRPAIGIAAGAPEGADAGSGYQLQSVMISPTRKAAIINGVTVRLGEKYGDAVLTKVAEGEVVLKSGASQQVLKIHPAVEKRELVPVSVVAPEPAAATSVPSKAKPKPKAKAQTKTTPQAKAKTQGGEKPAADASAGTQ